MVILYCIYIYCVVVYLYLNVNNLLMPGGTNSSLHLDKHAVKKATYYIEMYLLQPIEI